MKNKKAKKKDEAKHSLAFGLKSTENWKKKKIKKNRGKL